MDTIQRIKILGIPVDVVSMSSALEYIDTLIIKNSKGNCVLAVNPEKVIANQKNPLISKLFKKAALLIPDGIGVTLAIKLLYGIKLKRVPGSELMPSLCKRAAVKGYKIFVYGSKEHINKKAVEKLISLYPGIRIVGRCNGYIDQEKMEELIHRINKSRAHILFVALGSPKQEQWINQYLPKLNVNICQGIGGTLDTITGNTKRAPDLFLSTGLEWFYRLISEPKRIRRQMVLPIFALRIIREMIVVGPRESGIREYNK